MCQSIAEGGQRCAAHTRPRYQTTVFGSPEWDEAAAAYASTPTGRMELVSSLAAAEAAGDVRSAVAFEHALSEGARLREKAELFRDALTQQVPFSAVARPDETDAPGGLGEDDDDEFGGRVGGFAYVDEEAWEEQWAEPWSPTMSGYSWDAGDAVFSGCTPQMTSDEFIDQVCSNSDISRAEWEAAAADYFDETGVMLTFPDSGAGGGVRVVSSVGGSMPGDELRHAIVVAGRPDLTPGEIKAIAQLAREQREVARARAVEDASAVVPTSAEGGDSEGGRPGGAATSGRPGRPGSGRNRPALPDDPAALAGLSMSDDWETRADVAAHALTPTGILSALSNDAKIEVRAVAARNENTPVADLTRLVSDRSVKVRAGVARNPSLPELHVRALASDTNTTVQGAVARNPVTPPPVYARLSASESPTVRKHAARRLDIPAAIETSLVADPDKTVRATLGRNRSVSSGSLRALARDPEQSVRAAAARNVNLPTVLLRGRLSRDQAPGVRAAVARNENTSVATLTRLSSDSDPWVRRNVAWNHRTPAVLLYALAHDTDEGVASSARGRNLRPHDA